MLFNLNSYSFTKFINSNIDSSSKSDSFETRQTLILFSFSIPVHSNCFLQLFLKQKTVLLTKVTEYYEKFF
jgi:hypothetical protein